MVVPGICNKQLFSKVCDTTIFNPKWDFETAAEADGKVLILHVLVINQRI